LDKYEIEDLKIADFEVIFVTSWISHSCRNFELSVCGFAEALCRMW